MTARRPHARTLLSVEDARSGEELLELEHFPTRTVGQREALIPLRSVENELLAIREHAVGFDHGGADHVGCLR